MARRSSGSGFGILVLIIVGIVAAVPKEAWVGIGLFVGIAFVLYLFSGNKSRGESGGQVAPRIPNRKIASPSVPDAIDMSVTSATCWVGPSQIVNIKGLGSIGGMLYYGTGLGNVGGFEVEPALIDPKLLVEMSSGSAERMPYWPSYSGISDVARAGYIRWLAGGRKDRTVQIGYVFLFFYGLERRVLFDSKQHPEVAQELPELQAEVERLLSIYGGNGSFRGYATRFLDLIATIGAKAPLYEQPPPPQGPYKSLTLQHKLALGRAAVSGAPLPAEWAFSWLVNDERFYPRTPASRCPAEFKRLFLDAYSDVFGMGIKLPINKTKLEALYTPASASFKSTKITITGTDVPDVTILDGPINSLKEIAEKATVRLEPYSRFIGKDSHNKDSTDALVFLPPVLWPAEQLRPLTTWLIELGADTGCGSATVDELAQHFPAWSGAKKDGLWAYSAALESLRIGIEPDVRWGGPTPKGDSIVVLFPLVGEASALKRSSSYSAVALLQHLAVAVTVADGESSAHEVRLLEEQLTRRSELDPADLSRLRAHLKWLLLVPPEFTTLKKRVSVLQENQKREMANFLVGIAQSDGKVSPDEIKILKKVFRLFEFDEKELYSQLHAAATEPVTIRPAGSSSNSFVLPPKVVSKKKTRSKPSSAESISLDQDRIAALKADSERVSAILEAIFSDQDTLAPPNPHNEPQEKSTELSIAGLDPIHSELVLVLASRDIWTRTDLEALAVDRCIMLAGALEQINETFLDAYGEPLLEGEDSLEINRSVLKELQTA